MEQQPHSAVPAFEPGEAAAVAPVAGRRERFALRVVQLGALAAVLAAVTWKQFELDRFFLPKELVLHAAAFLAGAAALRSLRGARLTRVDLLLALFVLLGAVSAVLAQNPWLGARGLAISVSGVALFWTARALTAAGLERALLRGLALAVVLGTATALLQTYGFRTDFFSINRAPGGTLGNRNFIAHLAAFGFPVVLLAALRARRTPGYLGWSVGAALVVASLILTRSRAGWLAFGAVAAIFTAAMLFAPALRRDARTWLRLAGLLVLLGGGVAAAIVVPNTLRWRSDNPYLESMRGVANYQEGSGRGRLIQYRRSLRMAADNPLLGAGPGNWAVHYADYAARRDPSLDRSAGGMTSNPWPSSDWVAFVAERGFAATLALALALLAISLSALRQARRAVESTQALGAATLLATLAAAGVAGLFDAVLLLALPSLIVWSLLGALWTPPPAAPAARRPAPLQLALAVVCVLALAGAARSAAQLTAMGLYTLEGTGWLRAAALVDPGNYRVRLRLARSGSREQRCRHALAARELYPNAEAARRAARRCD